MVTESLTQAFVLHYRSYRETSLLVELFTKSHGKIAVIARGAKRKKSGVLQQFIPLLVSWRGRGSLPTLHVYETTNQNFKLNSSALLFGMCLNELLMLTLPRYDTHEVLFDSYQRNLGDLMRGETNKFVVLLRFGKVLLKELGYEIPLEFEAHSKKHILSSLYYRFVPETGFVSSTQSYSAPEKQQNIFWGKYLLQIADDNYESEETITVAKRLFQLALMPVLAGRHLRSFALLRMNIYDLLL